MVALHPVQRLSRARYEMLRERQAAHRERLAQAAATLGYRAESAARRAGCTAAQLLEATNGRPPRPGTVKGLLDRLEGARLQLLSRAWPPEELRELRRERDEAARALVQARALRRVATWYGRAARLLDCGERGEVARAVGDTALLVSPRAGAPIVRCARCDWRACWVCARRSAREKSRLLGRTVLEGQRRGREVLLATLTSRPPPEGVTLRASSDALRGAIRRWQRSRAVRRHLEGGRWGVESTFSTPESREARARRLEERAAALEGGARRRRGERSPSSMRASAARIRAHERGSRHWHTHAHLVVAPRGEAARLEAAAVEELREAWCTALASEWAARGWEGDPGGRQLHFQRPYSSSSAAKEAAKYAVKGTDLEQLDDEQLCEALLALDGARMSGDWGVLAEWRRALDDEDEDDDEREALGADVDEGERLGRATYRERGDPVLGRDSAGQLRRLSEVEWVPTTPQIRWEIAMMRAKLRGTFDSS